MNSSNTFEPGTGVGMLNLSNLSAGLNNPGLNEALVQKDLAAPAAGGRRLAAAAVPLEQFGRYDQLIGGASAGQHVKSSETTAADLKELADRIEKEGKVAFILLPVEDGGSYVQDWLLYPTDYNWRVLSDEGGKLRAIADIGTHWMDLLQTITGLSVELVKYPILFSAHFL